jgi:hypothetical protein
MRLVVVIRTTLAEEARDLPELAEAAEVAMLGHLAAQVQTDVAVEAVEDTTPIPLSPTTEDLSLGELVS